MVAVEHGCPEAMAVGCHYREREADTLLPEAASHAVLTLFDRVLHEHEQTQYRPGWIQSACQRFEKRLNEGPLMGQMPAEGVGVDLGEGEVVFVTVDTSAHVGLPFAIGVDLSLYYTNANSLH